MKIIVSYLSIFIIIVVFSGCTQSELYYYGSTEKELYQLKKEPNEYRLKNYKEALEEVIEYADYEGQLIPPGTYANLGYLYLQEGKKEEAIKMFETEKKLFPESTKFIDFVLKKM